MFIHYILRAWRKYNLYVCFIYVFLRIPSKISCAYNQSIFSEKLNEAPFNYTTQSISNVSMRCKENQFAPAFIQKAKHGSSLFHNLFIKFSDHWSWKKVTTNKDLRVLTSALCLDEAQDHIPWWLKSLLSGWPPHGSHNHEIWCPWVESTILLRLHQIWLLCTSYLHWPTLPPRFGTCRLFLFCSVSCFVLFLIGR